MNHLDSAITNLEEIIKKRETSLLEDVPSASVIKCTSQSMQRNNNASKNSNPSPLKSINKRRKVVRSNEFIESSRNPSKEVIKQNHPKQIEVDSYTYEKKYSSQPVKSNKDILKYSKSSVLKPLHKKKKVIHTVKKSPSRSLSKYSTNITQNDKKNNSKCSKILSESKNQLNTDKPTAMESNKSHRKTNTVKVYNYKKYNNQFPNYAKETLASKDKMIHKENLKKDSSEENKLLFIPSGTSNKSHHIGINIQQELHNQKLTRRQRTDYDFDPITAPEVRKAIANIAKEIKEVLKE